MSTAVRNKETLYTTSCTWGECTEDDTTMTFVCNVTVDFSKWYSNHPGGASISCNPRIFIWAYKYWDDDTPDSLRVDTRDITVSPSSPVWTATVSKTLLKSSSRTIPVYMGIAVYTSSEKNSIASSERLVYNSKLGSTTQWTSKKTMSKTWTYATISIVPESEYTSTPVNISVKIGGAETYSLPSSVYSDDGSSFIESWTVDHWAKSSAEAKNPIADYEINPGDTFTYANINTGKGLSTFTPNWASVSRKTGTAEFMYSNWKSDGTRDTTGTTMHSTTYVMDDREFIVPESFVPDSSENVYRTGAWVVSAPSGTSEYGKVVKPGESLGVISDTQTLTLIDEGQYVKPTTSARRIWAYVDGKWRMADPLAYMNGEWK